MNQNEDYIFTFVSIGETNGGNTVSRREFLELHHDCWQELLRSGLSSYVCARNGESLAPDKAVLRMMAYEASLATRQHLHESLLEHYQLQQAAKVTGRETPESHLPSKVEERFQQMRAELKLRSERARRVA